MALLDASEDGDPRTEDGEEGLSGSTGVPLRSVDAIAAHVPAIEDARAKVTGEMETMVLNGLTHLVRCIHTTCFLVNLRVMLRTKLSSHHRFRRRIICASCQISFKTLWPNCLKRLKQGSSAHSMSHKSRRRSLPKVTLRYHLSSEKN